MSHPDTDLSVFLNAITDPARRRILLLLKEKRKTSQNAGGVSATDIEQRVKLSQPTVSHHMRVLETAGLVEATRQGHWRLYRRNQKKIAEMIRALKRQL